jgi:hypothetical protein
VRSNLHVNQTSASALFLTDFRSPLTTPAHFVNTIKHQLFLLDDQPERVPPVPSVILDDPMSVDLDPQVEDDEDQAEYPTEDVSEDGLVGG